MYKLTKNFTLAENTCRCGCGSFGGNQELLDVIQALRDYLNTPVSVHSWFRCRAHNNRPTNVKNQYGVYGAGSNDSSYHLTGLAIDFSAKGIPNESIQWYLRNTYKNKYGVGLYDWGIHLDVRPNRTDWDNTDKAREDMYS